MKRLFVFVLALSLFGCACVRKRGEAERMASRIQGK